MNKLLAATVLAVACAPLAGCEGTTAQYSECVKSLETQNVAYENAAKNICADRYQGDLTAYETFTNKSVTNGVAGPVSTPSTGLQFSGYLDNMSKDRIITAYTISIYFPPDSKGHRKSVEKAFDGAFIMPSERGNFIIPADALVGYSDADFPAKDKDGNRQWSWNISDKKGLVISSSKNNW